MCEYLLEHGADIASADMEGWTSLHNASCYGHTHLIDLLMTHGANVNQLSTDHETPLYAAVLANKTEPVKKLFRHGADVNVANVFGCTPLYEAVSRDYLLCTWTLLDVGAELNNPVNQVAFKEKFNSLQFHEKIDLHSALKLLLEAGLQLDVEWLLRTVDPSTRSRFPSLNTIYRHVAFPSTLQLIATRVIRSSICKPISDNFEALSLPSRLKSGVCFSYYCRI